MFSMLGVSISDHFDSVMVFSWNYQLLAPFLLTVFWGHKTEASEKAQECALTVTRAGGLCILAGCSYKVNTRRKL